MRARHVPVEIPGGNFFLADVIAILTHMLNYILTTYKTMIDMPISKIGPHIVMLLWTYYFPIEPPLLL